MSENGITSDRNYQLQISYWHPGTAEEYGHTQNEIDNIRLMEKESQDAVLLYYGLTLTGLGLAVHTFAKRVIR